MAFINGPQMMRDIANMCHELFGTTIVYNPGWETLGNGQNWVPGGPKGFVDHHTAGGNNIYLDRNLVTGVPGLSGPLCNFAGLYDGDLALVAAYPANHAGASGGWDTAPLPVTGMFNREVLGIEMQYRGTEPMSAAQYRTLCAVNYCAGKVLGWDADYRRVKNHQGTSVQGKWDMGRGNGVTYDIAQVRRDIISLGKAKADESPLWEAMNLQMMGTRN